MTGHGRKKASSDLELEGLRYLKAAAESGNFGRAAEILGVQPSTISRSVADTEDKLGVTIFEKGHFGVRLTSAGKAVMEKVERLLSDLEGLHVVGQQTGAAAVGKIRLGVCMPPVGLRVQALLCAWRAKHPDVDLVLHELNQRAILLGMEQRRLDLALISKHALWPGAASEPICRERIMLAVPSGHRLVRAKGLDGALLRREIVLVQGWDYCQAEREFFASFLGNDVIYKSHPASQQTILALVGAKYGVTLVTKSVTEVRFPNVIYRPLAQGVSVELRLVWAPQNKEPVVGRFVAFMRDEARSRGLV